ncbi:MAG: hypothetical protein WC244_00995 [Patescibacteria group bacterium]|jgi:hypothetical protein
MEDDTKLKVILYLLVVLSAVALIGLWELFIKPGSIFIWQLIGPYVSQIWHMVF